MLKLVAQTSGVHEHSALIQFVVSSSVVATELPQVSVGFACCVR